MAPFCYSFFFLLLLFAKTKPLICFKVMSVNNIIEGKRNNKKIMDFTGSAVPDFIQKLFR